MKKLNQILSEGVYDPGIFKAFFLAGGPGSGKTFVTQSAFAGTGLKIVNSDTLFERGLKKANLSLKMPESEAEFRDIIRQRAKSTAGTILDTYMRGRLGLVIDATGRDKNVIQRQHALLTNLGYDCYMIFVNTNLDVALARNAQRARSVPIDLVKKSHSQIQRNMGKLQRLFGMKNFFVIDNNELNQNILDDAYKMVRKIVKRPIDNYTAKMWLQKEKEARKIKEDIKIPIKVGDTVLGGKFKNKRITIKKIGKNEKGDITFNDKPLLKVRIPNENT